MAVTADTASPLTLENLLRFKQQNIKEFAIKAQELARTSIAQGKTYTVYRLARELYDLGCDIEEMEDYIVSTRNSFFIYRFAKDVKTANVIKLQNALIASGEFDYVARMGCFVNGTDTNLIEKTIINSNNARAAYIYLTYGKHPNVQSLKNILIRSKKPRYLYALAKAVNDPQELEVIENLILQGKSHMYVRLFAQNIPGADIGKAEQYIIKTKNTALIQKFARALNSDKLNKLLLLF